MTNIPRLIGSICIDSEDEQTVKDITEAIMKTGYGLVEDTPNGSYLILSKTKDESI